MFVALKVIPAGEVWKAAYQISAESSVCLSRDEVTHPCRVSLCGAVATTAPYRAVPCLSVSSRTMPPCRFGRCEGSENKAVLPASWIVPNPPIHHPSRFLPSMFSGRDSPFTDPPISRPPFLPLTTRLCFSLSPTVPPPPPKHDTRVGTAATTPAYTTSQRRRQQQRGRRQQRSYHPIPGELVSPLLFLPAG